MTFLEFLISVVLKEADCQSDGSCSMNQHWMPLDNVCSFCALNYSLVSSMETFGEDYARVSKLLGVEVLEKEKEQHVHTAPASIQNVTAAHFALVPQDVVQRINQVYKLDFEMFDYNPYSGTKDD